MTGNDEDHASGMTKTVGGGVPFHAGDVFRAPWPEATA